MGARYFPEAVSHEIAWPRFGHSHPKAVPPAKRTWPPGRSANASAAVAAASSGVFHEGSHLWAAYENKLNPVGRVSYFKTLRPKESLPTLSKHGSRKRTNNVSNVQ